LAQDRKNLGFAISGHLHLNLLVHLAEKILLPQPLIFGGITGARWADGRSDAAGDGSDGSYAEGETFGTHVTTSQWAEGRSSLQVRGGSASTARADIHIAEGLSFFLHRRKAA
jgi:hypothetical protein